MHKFIWCVFFTISTSNVHGEYIFQFSWNFGTIGLGMNYASNDYDTVDVTVSVFNFILEHDDTNIGFECNPIRYRHLLLFNEDLEKDSTGDAFSFLNITAYWDLIKNKNILLGPLVSLNYFYVNTLTGLNSNEYMWSSGLRFSWRSKNNALFTIFKNYNLQINGEIGYRNIMGNHTFYFSINGDLLWLFYVYAEYFGSYEYNTY